MGAAWKVLSCGKFFFAAALQGWLEGGYNQSVPAHYEIFIFLQKNLPSAGIELGSLPLG
jgi:hypothetical protein